MKYIIHNKVGRILRIVQCAPAFAKDQAKPPDEFIMVAPAGQVNDVLQKVVGEGKLRRIINKTPQEMKEDLPALLTITHEKRLAHINNKQWQAVLKRLDDLENRSTKNGE